MTFLFSLYWKERNDHNSDIEHSRWALGQRDKIQKFTEYELNRIIIEIHIVLMECFRWQQFEDCETWNKNTKMFLGRDQLSVLCQMIYFLFIIQFVLLVFYTWFTFWNWIMSKKANILTLYHVICVNVSLNFF